MRCAKEQLSRGTCSLTKGRQPETSDLENGKRHAASGWSGAERATVPCSCGRQAAMAVRALCFGLTAVSTSCQRRACSVPLACQFPAQHFSAFRETQTTPLDEPAINKAPRETTCFHWQYRTASSLLSFSKYGTARNPTRSALPHRAHSSYISGGVRVLRA